MQLRTFCESLGADAAQGFVRAWELVQFRAFFFMPRAVLLLLLPSAWPRPCSACSGPDLPYGLHQLLCARPPATPQSSLTCPPTPHLPPLTCS